jgi:hypothetical protein
LTPVAQATYLRGLVKPLTFQTVASLLSTISTANSMPPNFCPHKGARLADGILCEQVIECELHGWQFDVRTGECLTVTERLKTYEVVIEEGLIKVLL